MISLPLVPTISKGRGNIIIKEFVQDHIIFLAIYYSLDVSLLCYSVSKVPALGYTNRWVNYYEIDVKLNGELAQCLDRLAFQEYPRQARSRQCAP